MTSVGATTLPGAAACSSLRGCCSSLRGCCSSLGRAPAGGAAAASKNADLQAVVLLVGGRRQGWAIGRPGFVSDGSAASGLLLGLPVAALARWHPDQAKLGQAGQAARRPGGAAATHLAGLLLQPTW
jgi:hypothetical protein